MNGLELLVLVGFIAFICEYADATIGMGYGTTLTPIMLLMGFEPIIVVQSVLIGQILGGTLGGYLHHRMGNVQIKHHSADMKIILILSGFGIFGSVAAVFFAVNIDPFILKIYVGVMVLIIGIIILIKRNHQMKLNWTSLSIVAVISAFNKGVSGGGYGPLITGGQLVSGRNAKNAVGSTTIAEVTVCIVSLITYIIVQREFYFPLILATSAGSILAAPLSAYTVKKMKAYNLKLIIGTVIIVLGMITLLKVII
ncbi:MAG: sulfite exporter TauE/SafE family protein [candidate division WOR-3 bacterium]|nr:sulfite exporter TauE/SafE family protein [candidate division WOR-3 bacterium]